MKKVKFMRILMIPLFISLFQQTGYKKKRLFLIELAQLKKSSALI